MSDTNDTFEYVPESEDLFDFDELQGAGQEAPAGQNDTIDLEELVAALPDLGEGESQLELTPNDVPVGAQPPEPDGRFGYGDPATVVVAGGGMSPGAIGLLMLVTLLNLVLIGFTWRTNRSLEEKVNDVSINVIRQATSLREEAEEQRARAEELLRPIVAPVTQEGRSFDLVRQDIERRDFGAARRKLYSILAVLDRFDETQRADVEARARYLIGDTLAMEASASMAPQLEQGAYRP